MNKRVPFIIIGLVLSFSTSLFSVQKLRIAVMDFESKNVPKATANMVSELIRTEMINIGKFTVVERAQMDQILKEQGVQQSGCTDTACAVQVGKMLSARKMLVGTVMKLGGRIIINGRIVDVEKGVADFGQKQDAKSEDDLYDAVADFCQKLSKRIKTQGEGGEYEEETAPVKEEKAKKEEKEEDTGPGFFERMFGGEEGAKEESAGAYEILLAGSYLMPGGKFADIAKSGYGANLGFNMNNLLFNSSVLTISAGYYMFEPKEDWIDSITSISGSLYLGYAIPLGSSFRIIPAIGGGYIMHTVSHDINGYAPSGDYTFTKDGYNDPLAAVKCSFNWAITNPVHIVIAPAYTFFFEKSTTNQIIGVDAGVNICF